MVGIMIWLKNLSLKIFQRIIAQIKYNYRTVGQKPKKYKKLKFRKGLAPHYPKKLDRLIRALLLHDFVHTEKHLSKIYEEIDIEDQKIREVCQNHHKCIPGDDFLLTLQYYDGLASYIAQKKPFRSHSRYKNDDL
jgi:hypothetical protein